MEVPKRLGKINNIEKFDAEYFDISVDQAHTLDPMSRCLLENVYEAIVDAGINPKNLHGTKTGVFVGVCYTESEKEFLYEKTQVQNISSIPTFLLNTIISRNYFKH